MIDKPTRLVPNKHYKKEVLMMCDKQDIIDYCHEMEQRLFQAMLIIDKLMERKELNDKDKEFVLETSISYYYETRKKNEKEYKND